MVFQEIVVVGGDNDLKRGWRVWAKLGDISCCKQYYYVLRVNVNG